MSRVPTHVATVDVLKPYSGGAIVETLRIPVWNADGYGYSWLNSPEGLKHFAGWYEDHMPCYGSHFSSLRDVTRL